VPMLAHESADPSTRVRHPALSRPALKELQGMLCDVIRQQGAAGAAWTRERRNQARRSSRWRRRSASPRGRGKIGGRLL